MNAQQTRRTLRFDTLEQALSEAESLTATAVTTSGNYSLGQILEHLARTIDVVNGDLQAPPIPLPLRLAGRLLRPMFLNRPMRSGFKLPSKAQSVFWPDHETDAKASLEHYRRAITRLMQIDPLPKHPLLGEMDRRQHEQLQCRHAELHLSFVHPVAN